MHSKNGKKVGHFLVFAGLVRINDTFRVEDALPSDAPLEELGLRF